MESKRVSKAVKSYVFFPAVADESSFSVLLFFLLSCSCNTGCCSAVWKSLEETSVKAHLSRQPFLGGETSDSVSTTRAWRVGLRVGSYVLWLCVLAPSQVDWSIISNCAIPHFHVNTQGESGLKNTFINESTVSDHSHSSSLQLVSAFKYILFLTGNHWTHRNGDGYMENSS